MVCGKVRKTLRLILDEKQKIDALYIQLQFYHIVLNSSAPESFFFQKSHSTKGKKVDFTSFDMEKNLLEVITSNMESVKEIVDLEGVVEEAMPEPTHKIVPSETRKY